MGKFLVVLVGREGGMNLYTVTSATPEDARVSASAEHKQTYGKDAQNSYVFAWVDNEKPAHIGAYAGEFVAKQGAQTLREHLIEAYIMLLEIAAFFDAKNDTEASARYAALVPRDDEGNEAYKQFTGVDRQEGI